MIRSEDLSLLRMLVLAGASDALLGRVVREFLLGTLERYAHRSSGVSQALISLRDDHIPISGRGLQNPRQRRRGVTLRFVGCDGKRDSVTLASADWAELLRLLPERRELAEFVKRVASDAAHEPDRWTGFYEEIRISLLTAFYPDANWDDLR